jgi:SAM-dependent methyltransferase
MDQVNLSKIIEKDSLKALEIRGLIDSTYGHQLMNEACCSLVIAYLRQSMSFDIGRIFSKEDMINELGVTERLQRYVDYFVAILLDDQVIEAIDSKTGVFYQVLPSINAVRQFKKIREELIQKHPMFTGNLKVLEHCVTAFPKALTEEISPISVLYPDGTNAMLESSYIGSLQELEETVIQQVYGRFIQDILARSKGTTIRILEAGGGFGLTMRHIAPMLKGYDVEYYFTDIGKTFMYQAKQYALEHDYDFFTFGLFDMTLSPKEQGLDDEYFDLVFSTNAVHATSKLSHTLSNLQSLIQPGGILCLIERTSISRYIDLIWGLADGWWHFDDQERELSPLMPLEKPSHNALIPSDFQ